MKQKALFILIILSLLSLCFLYWKKQTHQIPPTIFSFEDCVKAGNPVMESYPEKCMTPDRKIYHRVIEGNAVNITGSVVCLPHKDNKGPQTLECAFGLRDDQAIYYALTDPTMKFIPQLPMNDKVTIIGIEHPLKDPQTEKYAIAGTIEITSINASSSAPVIRPPNKQ